MYVHFHCFTAFTVKKGDRIAQLICERIYLPTLQEEKVSIIINWLHFLNLTVGNLDTKCAVVHTDFINFVLKRGDRRKKAEA